MKAPVRPVDWAVDGLRILDQTLLPTEERYVMLRSVDEVAEAIRTLRVRGAPLIGIVAAMGVAADATQAARAGRLNPEHVRQVADQLRATRPTAVNLSWALTRILDVADTGFARTLPAPAVAQALRAEAQRIWDEDAAMCRAIGESGMEVLADSAVVLTHCNAGALATGGVGTALAPIYLMHERGVDVDVFVTETRPLRQGARLTAWELVRAGIRATLVADSAAGALMSTGRVEAVITGADRIARNGDVANKIGTYPLAVLCARHRVPFFVAAPSSTLDRATPTGSAIPIEERPGAELDPAPGTSAWNPAFDVTPAELISAIITDRGVVHPPLDEGIGAVLADGQ